MRRPPRRPLLPLQLFGLLLGLLLGLPAAPAASAEPAPAERHAVVVSIDGLMPAYYLEADALGLAIPNLRRLMAEGAWAEGVVGVLPSVTYPSHTTLVTGVPPRLHGIGSNSIVDPEGRPAGPGTGSRARSGCRRWSRRPRRGAWSPARCRGR